jgi:hypothetical protein
MEEHAAHSTALQVAMFERAELPREAEVALFADRARAPSRLSRSSNPRTA